METKEVLLTRRSIRSYRSDPIPEADLKEILEAGLHAPSSVNLQPWYLVAVSSPEKRTELMEIMGQVFDKEKPLLEKRFAKHPEVTEETGRFLTKLGEAPVCILAFLLKDNYEDRDGVLQSVGAALENILLAAADRGLGSCWLTAPRSAGFGALLCERFAPGKGEFVAAVTLGYAAQSPKMPPRKDGRSIII